MRRRYFLCEISIISYIAFVYFTYIEFSLTFPYYSGLDSVPLLRSSVFLVKNSQVQLIPSMISPLPLSLSCPFLESFDHITIPLQGRC